MYSIFHSFHKKIVHSENGLLFETKKKLTLIANIPSCQGKVD
jgi:hypothetical protein